ncbi:MAG: HipA N-terminal domain-containing protein [Bacteroidota bacterium]
MRKLNIYHNGILSGVLTEENRTSYIFRYDDAFYNDSGKPAISLTLPKTQQEYRSASIFPFFSNMIAEGANREIQCRYLKIDENDVMSLLAATATTDTIGAVTVKQITSQ